MLFTPNFNGTVESWLGTKFHYYGRIKKNALNNGGVDCIGLVIKIGEECFDNRIGQLDYLSYSRFPNMGEMKRFFDKYFLKISWEDLKIGDIFYFNFKNKLEHTAIYIYENRILHCSTSSKRVVDEQSTEFWREKIVSLYRYKF
jgi:cell wall-associated NlpC family hydrolase